MDGEPPFFVSRETRVGAETVFSTTCGGYLSVLPGEMLFDIGWGWKHRGTNTDALSAWVRLADQQGRGWMAESVWPASVIAARLFDYRSPLPPCIFTGAPEGWKEAFESRIFIEGARTFLDDRHHRMLLLGEQRYDVPFQFLSPTLDVAFGTAAPSEPAGFVGRLTGLIAKRHGSGAAIVQLSPVAFSWEADGELFVNRGYADTKGEWRWSEVPTPLVFESMESIASLPQSTVRFIPT
jgi:hypothetical protein